MTFLSDMSNKSSDALSQCAMATVQRLYVYMIRVQCRVHTYVPLYDLQRFVLFIVTIIRDEKQ